MLHTPIHMVLAFNYVDERACLTMSRREKKSTNRKIIIMLVQVVNPLTN
jgi:hypothetical protein